MPQQASKELVHQSLRSLGLNPGTGGTQPAEPAQTTTACWKGPQTHLSLFPCKEWNLSVLAPAPLFLFCHHTPAPNFWGVLHLFRILRVPDSPTRSGRCTSPQARSAIAI